MKTMPKGAVLHLHSTAAVDLEFLIREYTNEPYYWFNKEKRDIKYSKTEVEGYHQLTKLRESMGDLEVDRMLLDLMKLTRKDLQSGESMVIWDEFQYKFTMTGDLFNLRKNFKKNITRVFQECVEDGIDHAELRHATNLVFDENHQPISCEEEFTIIKAALDDF